MKTLLIDSGLIPDWDRVVFYNRRSGIHRRAEILIYYIVLWKSNSDD
ncbi:MAG TPA: hypothetical protein VHO70_12875 [Chitinispirillaceae bacterium]|nr:hypothetical protein [Chitinispirillaceae bacterium]